MRSAQWLHNSERVAPLEAALKETQRRHRHVDDSLRSIPPSRLSVVCHTIPIPVPGSSKRFTPMMLLQPGATLGVNLPTGSGKSLVDGLRRY